MALDLPSSNFKDELKTLVFESVQEHAADSDEQYVKLDDNRFLYRKDERVKLYTLTVQDFDG